MGTVDDHHFERLYRKDDDPWRVATAWYERRKRAVLLATLTRERYGHIFEAGCGGGDMTLALAQRCDQLCAVDLAPSAVRRVQARLRADPVAATVRTLALKLPQQWPPVPSAGFDLIVVSELAYYLADAACALFLARLRSSLGAGGELVACHWRPAFDDRLQPTDRLHDAMGALPGLQRLVHHHEEDFRLDLWRNPL